MRRPSKTVYEQSLQLYRAGFGIDAIAERCGLALEDVEQLEAEGWPATDGAEALPAFRTRVIDRRARVRNDELDWLQHVAEGAAKGSARRTANALIAANIEGAILQAWGKRVEASMKAAGRAGDLDPATLCMPKIVLDNLRALRQVQDPAVDRGFVDHFKFLRGDDGPADRGGEIDDIISDLAMLTPEEQEEYVRTGKPPRKQQELPFPPVALEPSDADQDPSPIENA